MAAIGIETTQHVKLNYNPAPVGDRWIAFILDGFVLFGYNILIRIIFGALEEINLIEENFESEQFGVVILISVIVPFFYHLFCEVIWNGKSFGKWVMGLQVVRVDGTNPTFGNYLIRWMFRLLEITLTSGLLAFITILINGKGQRLGDMAAKTCVIKIRRKVQLSDTIYSETDQNYTISYPLVSTLTDEEIATVKEVLSSRKKYEYATWFVMVQRTANIIQMKLNVKKLESEADKFLEQVISDYNHVHES